MAMKSPCTLVKHVILSIMLKHDYSPMHVGVTTSCLLSSSFTSLQ